MDPQEWLTKSATRSDLAAAAVGYAVGFSVDVFFFPMGVPPGTTAGVFAVGMVGLKNSVQTTLEGFNGKKRVHRDRSILDERAAILHQTLSDEKLGTLAGKLARDIRLWRKGVLKDDDFQQIVEEVVREYRKRELDGPDPSNLDAG